jgi:hypothetical protein
MVTNASKKLLLPSSGQKMEAVTCLPEKLVYIMGLQPFYGNEPHLIWAGLQAAHEKMTITGVPNCLIYCEIFIVYTVYKCGHRPHNTTW